MTKQDQNSKWYDNYPIVTDPKDFFGNVRKGHFVKIANIEIPLKEAKKYSSKEECLRDNMTP